MWAWVLAAVVPLTKKVLIALGFGWITYTGITAALDAAKGHLLGYWSQIPPSISNIIELFGFGEAVGIVLGALSARAALMVVERFGKVTT